ncbi:MAG: hypothetical protein AB8G05_19955 [Oligoflexales bacterium]
MHLTSKFMSIFILLISIFITSLANGSEDSNPFDSIEEKLGILSELIKQDSITRMDKKDAINKFHEKFKKNTSLNFKTKRSESEALASLLIAMQLWHRNRDFASAKIEVRIVNTIGNQAFWHFIPMQMWTSARAQLWVKTRTYFAHQTGHILEESLKESVIATLKTEMKEKVDSLGMEIKEIFHKNLTLSTKLKSDLDSSLVQLLTPITEDQLDFKNSLEIACDYIKVFSQVLHFELYNSLEFRNISKKFAGEISSIMSKEEIKKSIKAFEVVKNRDKYSTTDSYVNLQLEQLKALLN